MNGELAKVVKVNWGDNTVDLVFMRTGRPVRDVRVMSPTASSNTGLNDLQSPASSGDFDKAGISASGRNIIACVQYFHDQPVVVGFLPPIATQLRFVDEERMIYRHASDVYKTIDKDGNIEIRHPGGAYVRFGTSAAHEDLTGKDFNKKWKITKNTDKQIHLHIEQANGKAVVDIAPDGAITITTAATVSVNATGNATVTSGGNVEVNAAGTAKVISGGKVTVKGTAIDLNTGAMKGVVTGDCVCAFTGAPHSSISTTVKAGM